MFPTETVNISFSKISNALLQMIYSDTVSSADPGSLDMPAVASKAPTTALYYTLAGARATLKHSLHLADIYSQLMLTKQSL